MAHGSPDYWSKSHIDILSQTASYLAQRPIYGKAKGHYYDNTVSSDITYELHCISGTGKLYSGYIYFGINVTLADYTIIVDLDDEDLIGITLERVFDWGLYSFDACVISLLKWDASNNIYVAAIRPDITFESSLNIRVQKWNSEEVRIASHLFYALV